MRRGVKPWIITPGSRVNRGAGKGAPTARSHGKTISPNFCRDIGNNSGALISIIQKCSGNNRSIFAISATGTVARAHLVSSPSGRGTGADWLGKSGELGYRSGRMQRIGRTKRHQSSEWLDG